MTDGRAGPGSAGRAVRAPPQPADRGRLPLARLVERGRRRGAGDLAAFQPHRRFDDREPRQLVDRRRCPAEPEHAARPRQPARGTARAARPARPRAGRAGPRSRGRSDARRLGRRGPAHRARLAVPGRTPGVRPARLVPGAVRRDRRDRGPHSGNCPQGRQPGPRARSGRPGPTDRNRRRAAARAGAGLSRGVPRRGLRRAATPARPRRRAERGRRGRAVRGRGRGARARAGGPDLRRPRAGGARGPARRRAGRDLDAGRGCAGSPSRSAATAVPSWRSS